MGRLLLLVAVGLATTGPGCRHSSDRPNGSGRIKHVIVMTVDGLKPESYTEPDRHGLKVPTLRAMVAGGGSSPGARSVYPPLTFPAHTTIATGRNPVDHGIHSNFAFDPEEKGGLFHDDVGDIRARTLWDAARDAGLSTAIVNWPVAVGARVDVLVPEVWSDEPDDLEKETAISTPGLFARVEKRFPGFLERVVQKDKAPAFIDIAVTVILEDRPSLMFVHTWDTDAHQHADGLWSPPALAAIETADAQIARLIDACKQAGIWDTTVLVLLSDHGFTPVSRQSRPGVPFAADNLVTLGADDKPTAWRAVFLGGGGQGYVYLRDPADDAARNAALAIGRDLASKPEQSGVARLLMPDQIRELGGDPAAAFGLEATDGTVFTRGYRGELLEPTELAAAHGFDPARTDMQASMIFFGPSIGHGAIENARLIDVAPTVAGLLGLHFEASGHVLALPPAK